ncbi:hypothetical protein FC83_GL003245 [Agrilactobacillus composti DSM 18527 = JCM 14202]|uniref:Uncharacterized protein n=2 Tax=Agrilactobacillus TaxID=2767875 RepID=A0A0R1Y1I9_9LACO|nr:hypothetical protein FC83_GL003245 [Agrilactobacillus composti DSM 18527 = JCM 14202]
MIKMAAAKSLANRLVVALLRSGLMSIVMSLIIVGYHQGYFGGLFKNWTIAFIASFILGIFAKDLVTRLYQNWHLGHWAMPLHILTTGVLMSGLISALMYSLNSPQPHFLIWLQMWGLAFVIVVPASYIITKLVDYYIP